MDKKELSEEEMEKIAGGLPAIIKDFPSRYGMSGVVSVCDRVIAVQGAAIGVVVDTAEAGSDMN